MGKHIFIIELIFLFGLNSTSSYSQQFMCGMSETLSTATPLTHIGGKYITAQGTITSFVLFVRFSDDNETTPQ